MAWSYEMLLFSKDFETLIINLSVIFSRWFSRLTRVLFYMMLGSDRDKQVQDMMLWSSGDELDDDTYSRTCYYFSAVYSVVCYGC